MSTLRRFSCLLALLLSLALLPIAADAAPTGKTYNLTQQFGIRDVWELRFFDGTHAAVVSIQPGKDDLKHFTATFLSLTDERVTGQASFARRDAPVGVGTQGERLSLLFETDDADDTATAREEILIAQGGAVTTRDVPAEEVGFALPGGARIIEENGSLLLRGAAGDALKPLLTGIPYPEADDSPDPLYFCFFAALDEHRFVYTRFGWDGARKGCGMYDLTTGESRRLDERGVPCLLYEGRLFTTQSVVDINTCEAVPLPSGIQAGIHAPGQKWALSADGKLLCELLKPPEHAVPALRFRAMDTGEQLGVLDMDFAIWAWPTFIAQDTVGIVGRTTDGKDESLLLIAGL